MVISIEEEIINKITKEETKESLISEVKDLVKIIISRDKGTRNSLLITKLDAKRLIDSMLSNHLMDLLINNSRNGKCKDSKEKKAI